MGSKYPKINLFNFEKNLIDCHAQKSVEHVSLVQVCGALLLLPLFKQLNLVCFLCVLGRVLLPKICNQGGW